MSCSYKRSLEKVLKPSRYIGGEFNSAYKKAETEMVLLFPDKYEVGISNFGFKILYSIVNSSEKFSADRAYAPDKDFADELEENKIPLYGVESKKPIKDFDLVGISLSYEICYPTVLKLLELSDIPIKSSERNENHPIIMAGGVCCFNPLPMNKFIDVFLLGDGEEILLEVLEVYNSNKGLTREEKLKKMSEIDGVYVPSIKSDKAIKKRTVELKYETQAFLYPISHVVAVHDRAVVEIRRGCERMCRFCQSCFVNLPVRERPGAEIVKTVKDLVDNTGYSEYSLLSLSSNDHTNIIPILEELNEEFKNRKISTSLPSQRADKFDSRIAELTQSLRRTTTTIAPEAGSQRLRDAINKKLSKEQIVNACLNSYLQGSGNLKLYFMMGLPTETEEDLKEIAELVKSIKYRSSVLKKENNLSYNMSITCSVSIFVPKPHTPFQWCCQPDDIDRRIKVLRDAFKDIKGVKLKIHDRFLSMLEAVLARGDERIGDYIEELYNQGAYLDAWVEHFNPEVWEKAADFVGINLQQEAAKTFDIEKDLPWDFIHTGVDKTWLQGEYKNALNSVSTESCDTKCVRCGVCGKGKIRKSLAKSYVPDIKKTDLLSQDICFKYRISLTKTGNLRYLSHLDWQNLVLKAFNRTKLKLRFSQGFNPTPKVSLGIALPIFVESKCEFIDVELLEEVSVGILKDRLEKAFPKEVEILDVKSVSQNEEALDVKIQWAEYFAKFVNNPLPKNEKILYIINGLLSQEEIFIEKVNKKGLKNKVDIRKSIELVELQEDGIRFILKTGKNIDGIPSLRPDDFIKMIDTDIDCEITKIKIYDFNMKEL